MHWFNHWWCLIVTSMFILCFFYSMFLYIKKGKRCFTFSLCVNRSKECPSRLPSLSVREMYRLLPTQLKLYNTDFLLSSWRGQEKQQIWFLYTWKGYFQIPAAKSEIFCLSVLASVHLLLNVFKTYLVAMIPLDP